MNEIKRAINTNLAKGSIHIFTGSMGIENKRDKNRIHTLSTNSSWDERRPEEETRSHDPNQLIGHHNRATKRHKAIP